MASSSTSSPYALRSRRGLAANSNSIPDANKPRRPTPSCPSDSESTHPHPHPTVLVQAVEPHDVFLADADHACGEMFFESESESESFDPISDSVVTSYTLPEGLDPAHFEWVSQAHRYRDEVEKEAHLLHMGFRDPLPGEMVQDEYGRWPSDVIGGSADPYDYGVEWVDMPDNPERTRPVATDLTQSLKAAMVLDYVRAKAERRHVALATQRDPQLTQPHISPTSPSTLIDVDAQMPRMPVPATVQAKRELVELVSLPQPAGTFKSTSRPRGLSNSSMNIPSTLTPLLEKLKIATPRRETPGVRGLRRVGSTIRQNE